MVAKGYNQVEGLDSFETFSQVKKISNVNILLFIAFINQWYLHQLDVSNPFLHEDLEEGVYMLVPQGVSCAKPMAFTSNWVGCSD